MTGSFAPKPEYAIRYWRRRGLTPPRVDVLEVVAAVCRYLTDLPPRVEGTVALGDARTLRIF